MLQEIEISRLNDAPYNPRIPLLPGSPQYESLKASIEEFGDARPIVWNRQTGHVVGGHQRLAVMKDLGYTTAWCSVVDMDLAEEKLLNVALNKIKGRWDYDKLEELVKDLDRDLLEMTSGFTAAELALLESSTKDILDDDSYWEEWNDEEYDEEGGAETYGQRYVVILVFDGLENARKWAETEGHSGYVKDGKESTVIQIGDEADEG